MKLVKLSLAAIVAAGALTSVASAASLEEAIKNVDVTGYARYRFDSTAEKEDGLKTHNAKHRFTSDIDFKAALDDNFFGVIGFRYDSRDTSGERAGAQTNVGSEDKSSGDGYSQTFNVRQFYLGYTAGNTTVTAGRQVLGTFFTDDMVGTGIKVLNSDISGLTLAAIAFDNLQADGDIGTSILNIASRSNTPAREEFTYDRNLYGVAAIGSYDPVSFQVWYAALDSVAQLYALDVTVGANLGDVDVSLQAQYAGSSLWADNAALAGSTTIIELDNAQFWAAELGAKAYGFNGSVGYIQFDTDKDKASLISFEDQGAFISPGEDLLDYTAFLGESKYWFLTAGYTYDKFSAGIDYIDGDSKDSFMNNGIVEKTDEREIVYRLGYNYSKKLNFKLWYSDIEEKGDGWKDTAEHLRFEARYNF